MLCCSAGIEQDVVQQPVSDGTCYVVVLVLNKMLYNNLRVMAHVMLL